MQAAWNMIGAAFAAAAPGIPSWSAGFQEGNNMGGLLAAVLAPAGGFGKLLLVLMALSISSACITTIYSFGEFNVTCIGWCFSSSIILETCFFPFVVDTLWLCVTQLIFSSCR